MCGICGELEFDPASGASAGEFERLIALMARRGPDDQGYWAAPAGGGRRCRLGFRRLAILDLSPAANQPMVDLSGRFGLVYNGELYNFRELRGELEQRGVEFSTTGDTEVVLQALIQWGEAALARFNGMFALGFYDRDRCRLLLARDHAGIKPLYFMVGREGVFFASQYDQIMAHPWRADRPVSQEGLGLYLRLGYIPAPYAILDGTRLLQPGSWLSVSADRRVSHGTFYTFPVYQKPDLFGEEANEAVDAAVEAAVKRHMVSDVPLGAFLSGGIDSPLVTAKMQAGTTRRVRTYTIGSAGSQFDESEDAAIYARSLGVEHTLEHFTPEQAIDWLSGVIDACSEPFADDSIFPTLMVSHLARRDLTVALSGDGGDELFWGYARRAGSILQHATDFQRDYWFRSAEWAIKRVTLADRKNDHLRWPTIGNWQREKHSLIQPNVLSSIFDNPPPWPKDVVLFDYDGWESGKTAQWLRWNEFVGHLTKVLLKVDRASMYNSLEVRVPLLDREVIDVALRLDWRECLDIQTETGKQPLRKALGRHVKTQTQPKRGFQVPLDDWFRGPLRGLFQEAFRGRTDLLGVPVHKSGLQTLLNDHDSGYAEASRSLWCLLSLALWSDRYWSSPGFVASGKEDEMVFTTAT
jgi:asparagine synthase (glutamine-hydrolysing)